MIKRWTWAMLLLSGLTWGQGVPQITCRGTPLSLGYRHRRHTKLMMVAQSAPITLTSSLILRWNLDANVATYNIKRGVVTGGPYTTLGTTVTGTGCVDNRVAQKTTYFYVISGTNTVGTSSNSSEVQATTP